MAAFLDVERQCGGRRACFVIRARMITSGSVSAMRWSTITWSSWLLAVARTPCWRSPTT